MRDKEELPAGCAGCLSTLPCEETCGADPFAERDLTNQTAEDKDCARPPGSYAAYIDNIVGPIEGYAQGVFAKDKPLYEELLRICVRLRKIIT